MIVSASRRTDIPAFYSEWMIERLKSGAGFVRNPFNPHQVSKVILNPEAVDCFVSTKILKNARQAESLCRLMLLFSIHD